MWELDNEEGRAQKNWCFWTVVLEKTPESPLDCKEIQLVNLKGNQPWIFIRRTDAEAELQYFGHLMRRADSLEKTLMLVRLGRRRRGQQGWDDWVASSVQWTWTWANSRRQWQTGRPGMLQSMGSRRVKHDLVTEQQQFSSVLLKWTYSIRILLTAVSWDP